MNIKKNVVKIVIVTAPPVYSGPFVAPVCGAYNVLTDAAIVVDLLVIVESLEIIL